MIFQSCSFLALLLSSCLLLLVSCKNIPLRPFQPQYSIASTSLLAASGTDEYDTPATESFYASVRKNMGIVYRGSGTIISDLVKSARIRKIKKLQGLQALSFTQYKFLQQAKTDVSKCFRLLITLPLSPEFVFYSYIVFPLLSTNNVWAWRNLPSGFDDPRDAAVRERAMGKRRMQTVVAALHAMLADTLDDTGLAAQRAARRAQIARIEEACAQSSMAGAMQVLQPWLVSEPRQCGKITAAAFRSLPGQVVKQCLRSLGEEGVPNIPLVRRFNIGELNARIERIRDSDNFLHLVGVKSLSPQELEVACFERCIPTDHKSTTQLRTDLGDWLVEVNKPITVGESAADLLVGDSAQGGAVAGGGAGGKSSSSLRLPMQKQKKPKQLVTNFQNKRLALMALHSVKGLKASEYCSVYRAVT